MKIRYTILALALLAALGLGSIAQASTTFGTVEVTGLGKPAEKGIKKITWACTSDSSGRVTNNDVSVSGRLARITFDPNPTVTADWDIDLLDDAGIDLLFGLGVNHSSAMSQEIFFDSNPGVFTTVTLSQTVNTNSTALPWNVAVSDTLTLTITNLGNATSVNVTMYVKEEE